jgi:hypothetical protein
LTINCSGVPLFSSGSNFSQWPVPLARAKNVGFADIAGRKTPHSIARLSDLFSCHWKKKTCPQLEEVILAEQQQINRAPMNALKNLFLEGRTGRSDAKSGLGRMMPPSVVTKKFIDRGN